MACFTLLLLWKMFGIERRAEKPLEPRAQISFHKGLRAPQRLQRQLWYAQRLADRPHPPGSDI